MAQEFIDRIPRSRRAEIRERVAFAAMSGGMTRRATGRRRAWQDSKSRHSQSSQTESE